MKQALRDVVLAGLEQPLEPLKAARAVVRRPAHGWLRAVRESLGLSQANVATKLDMSRQAYADLERAEARGAISLNSLERAAAAMECELVYFVLPREAAAQNFTELAQRHDPKQRHLAATEHSMALEGQAVGDRKQRPAPASPP
jgi:predicted DNA-binding mobile mystery protein A